MKLNSLATIAVCTALALVTPIQADMSETRAKTLITNNFGTNALKSSSNTASNYRQKFFEYCLNTVQASKVVATYSSPYKVVNTIGSLENWTSTVPDLSNINNLLPYIQEWYTSAHTLNSKFGDCDALGTSGKEYQIAKCFGNILRRCTIIEDKCQYNLRHQGAAEEDGTFTSAILKQLQASPRTRGTFETFAEVLVNSVFQVKPTQAEVVFGLSVVYARMIGASVDATENIFVGGSYGLLHNALYPVSNVNNYNKFEALVNFAKVGSVTKRAMMPTISEDLYNLCDLTVISKDIIVGCLAGIVADGCSDPANELICQTYYANTFSKSVYSQIGRTCPKWKNGPKSQECASAVSGICNKSPVNLGQCKFAKYCKDTLFRSKTYAMYNEWDALP